MRNIQTNQFNRPGVTMSAYAVGKSVIQVRDRSFGIHENPTRI
jgi:hypothetical protein